MPSQTLRPLSTCEKWHKGASGTIWRLYLLHCWKLWAICKPPEDTMHGKRMSEYIGIPKQERERITRNCFSLSSNFHKKPPAWVFSLHERETQSHLYSILSRAILFALEVLPCLFYLLTPKSDSYPEWLSIIFWCPLQDSVAGPLNLNSFTYMERLLAFTEYGTTCKQWSRTVAGSGPLLYFGKQFIGVYLMCRGPDNYLPKAYDTPDILYINHFQLYWLSLSVFEGKGRK